MPPPAPASSTPVVIGLSVCRGLALTCLVARFVAQRSPPPFAPGLMESAASLETGRRSVPSGPAPLEHPSSHEPQRNRSPTWCRAQLPKSPPGEPYPVPLLRLSLH